VKAWNDDLIRNDGFPAVMAMEAITQFSQKADSCGFASDGSNYGSWTAFEKNTYSGSVA
jgi:hypothetical protein